MKKVVLNPNPTRDKNLDCTRKVASFFKENGVEVCISKEIIGAETTGATLSEFAVAAKDADMIISLAETERFFILQTRSQDSEFRFSV